MLELHRFENNDALIFNLFKIWTQFYLNWIWNAALFKLPLEFSDRSRWGEAISSTI